jgi:hypothetical protein
MELCNVIGLTKTRNLGAVKERASTSAKAQDAQKCVLIGDLETFICIFHLLETILKREA